MPVRVAAPAGIGGLVDTLLNPSYSTAVGLLQWGAISLDLGRAAALRVGARRRRPGPPPRGPAERLPLGRAREPRPRPAVPGRTGASPPGVREPRRRLVGIRGVGAILRPYPQDPGSAPGVIRVRPTNASTPAEGRLEDDR